MRTTGLRGASLKSEGRMLCGAQPSSWYEPSLFTEPLPWRPGRRRGVARLNGRNGGKKTSLIFCNPSWLTQAPWKTLLLRKPYSTFPPGTSQQTAGQEEGGASVYLRLLQEQGRGRGPMWESSHRSCLCLRPTWTLSSLRRPLGDLTADSKAEGGGPLPQGPIQC